MNETKINSVTGVGAFLTVFPPVGDWGHWVGLATVALQVVNTLLIQRKKKQK